MEDLKASYESLGFKNIKTYVQSGNVIFTSNETDLNGLSNVISNKIKQMFNLSVVVFLRTPGELQKIVSGNPFLKEEVMDANTLYITFLSKKLAGLKSNQVKATRGGSDRFVIANREIYLYCPHGYGGTRFSNEFFEKALGIIATTRNWKTVNTLLEMAAK